MDQSTNRLKRLPQAEMPGTGSGPSQIAHANHNQRGVHLNEVIVSQAQPLHHAGSEVLYYHIAPTDQSSGDLLSLSTCQVQASIVFAAVILGEIGTRVDS